VSSSLWEYCLNRLEGELDLQEFNTYIRPLQAIQQDSTLRLYAPNQFVVDWVQDCAKNRINALLSHYSDGRIEKPFSKWVLVIRNHRSMSQCLT
jgi:chromosomal replication initiator protein